jgi:hypothetical protein
LVVRKVSDIHQVLSLLTMMGMRPYCHNRLDQISNIGTGTYAHKVDFDALNSTRYRVYG